MSILKGLTGERMREVLVIDDEPLVCEVIAAALEDWPDTNVTCAQDGIAGAEKLRESHFDLALIDGSLPGLSGIQLAAIAANANIPALLLSGDADVNQQAAAFGLPCLPKPFTMSELLLSSKNAVAQADENIARVKASTARMQDSASGLRADIATARASLVTSHELLAKLTQTLEG